MSRTGIPRRSRAFKKGAQVLATLLIAYPEVSRATFDPESRTLSFVFLCKGPLSKARQNEIRQLYLDSVETYLALEGREKTVLEAGWEKMGSYFSFQVERDVASLSSGELNMTTDLLSSAVRLIPSSDKLEGPPEGDDLSQSARVFVQEVLDEVRSIRTPRKLVALREGEKVLVFDK